MSPRLPLFAAFAAALCAALPTEAAAAPSEAETLARRQLAGADSARGPDSIEAADAIDSLLEKLLQERKTKGPEAEVLARRAVSIREKRQPDSVELASSDYILASLLRINGDFPRALPLYEKTLALQEKHLGPNDFAVAKTLNGLGMLFHRTQRLEDAAKAYDRAIAIRTAALGAEHPDVALILGNLANVLRDQERLEESIALHEKALAIREKAYGPRSREVLANVSGLANALMIADEYERAREVFERELALSVEHYGPESSPAGIARQHLAVPNELLGDYRAALEHAEHAVRIDEKELGPDHPDLAGALNTLASIRASMGNLPEARDLYARARSIWSKAIGAQNPRTAQATANLGRVEHELGHGELARTLLGEALAAQGKALGENALEAAFTLEDLAEIEMDEANYAAARKLQERALAIRTNRLGAESPLTAQTMRRLAQAMAGAGETAAAEGMLERTAALEERSLGPAHPSLAETLAELASVRWRAGRPEAAREPALRAEAIGRDHLRETARVLSERDALRYERVRASGAGIGLAIAADRPTAQNARAAWDAVIRSRALVLDEMAARHRAVVSTQDADTAALAQRLESARRRLARLALAGADADDAKGAGRFESARRDRDEAERALAAKSAAFRDARAAENLGWTDVVGSLPEHSVLVSFAAFDHPERGPEYVAFVALAGADSARVAPLGSRAAIDSAVVGWNRAVRASAAAHPKDEAQAAAHARRAGEALRDLVWTPVEPLLGGRGRLFLVPDAALHLVNFAALPRNDAEFLLDRIEVIHCATAERDLVALEPTSPSARERGASHDRILLVGAPDFDDASRFAALDGSANPLRADRNLPRTIPFRGALPGGDEFAKLRFPPLPGSAREIREVESAWRKSLGFGGFLRSGGDDLLRLEGAEASEARVKSDASGRRVLHFATHGFVREDFENPLLAAGLALAGANHRDAASGTEEDGILTAEEIASLDLSAVEWVVLSACESGLGQAVAGEGVFGLRRAFQVAGARTILMTLWPVDDDAALEWIRELYAGRLDRGLATDEAVCGASRAILKRLRERREIPHPFLWANYVAAGDWR